MRTLRIISGGLAIAAGLLLGEHTSSAAVLAPVTDGLFVGLDGSSVLLDNEGNVKVWYDQIGNAEGQYQDYGRQSGTDRPALSNVQMPNGTFHNVVNFGAGGSIFLESKSAATNRITDVSGTFTAGADSAYENQTMTWFFVFKQTAADTKSIWRGNHASPLATTDYGAFIENDVVIAHSRDTVGNGGIVTNPLSIAGANRTNWYIVAGTVDTVNNEITSTLLGLNGVPTSATRDDTDLAALTTHVLSRLGGNPASNSGGFNGQIAEMLLYNTVLGTDDIENVMGYLNEKYLVPEPSSVLLTGMAIVGIGCIYRRKRRK